MGEIKDKIREANDLERELWHSDKWGVDIEVRTMMLEDYTKFSLAISNKKGKVNEEKFGAALIAHCSFEPGTENKIFDSIDEAAEILNKKCGDEAQSLMKLAMRLNGLTSDVVVDVKNA